jgi:cytochrome c oxidase subunit 2
VDHLIRKSPFKACLIFSFASLLNGCAEMPASLDPKGSAAHQITNLGWLMFVLGTAIWFGVMLLLAVGLFRRRKTLMYEALPPNENARTVNLWVVGGGIIMPTVILIGLVASTVGVLRSIPFEKTEGSLVIEVTGHQWWWQVHYPASGITRKDEMRIPAGQPVEVVLSSADVIHSFWVPELHGKFDLVPGRTFEFILQADRPGEYEGRCAEFCGTFHTRMTFIVIAMPPEEFITWLGSTTGEANEP